MNIGLNLTDFMALSPLLIIFGAALLVLVIESFSEQLSQKFIFFLTIFALALALLSTYTNTASDNPLLTPWLRFDFLSHLLNIIFLFIALGTTLLSYSFFQNFKASQGEYFFLLLSSLFGLMLIGMAADFLTIFLGLETLSLALYVLCGYMKRWKISQEASIKYFLMGSLASAFLLYGIALIYGATGTTRLDALMGGYQSLLTIANKTLFLSGIALVTLGIAFKATIVPFHTWAPDVYDGSTTPITAFMTVGTKTGAFAAFTRIFLEALPQFNLLWSQVMVLLIYPTLIYANFVALRQTQLRRFFAYSGISHSGFLLIPIAIGTTEAIPALMFYLIVYALATFGAFAVLTFIDNREEGVMLSDLNGLFHRQPLIAGLFTLCLLTLAGIPPTAGFFSKFYIIKLAFQAGYIGLTVVALLTTILSAFYYLRIVGLMFSKMPQEKASIKYSFSGIAVGLVSLNCLLFLSCYPNPILIWLFKVTN